jgi:hypothetical protein
MSGDAQSDARVQPSASFARREADSLSGQPASTVRSAPTTALVALAPARVLRLRMLETLYLEPSGTTHLRVGASSEPNNIVHPPRPLSWGVAASPCWPDRARGSPGLGAPPEPPRCRYPNSGPGWALGDQRSVCPPSPAPARALRTSTRSTRSEFAKHCGVATPDQVMRYGDGRVHQPKPGSEGPRTCGEDSSSPPFVRAAATSSTATSVPIRRPLVGFALQPGARSFREAA